MSVRKLLAAALAALLLAPLPALAAFPGGDPDESVRINTPDDPEFDHCEPDDEQGADCSNVFGQEYERFGFAPSASQHTARYEIATAAGRVVARGTAGQSAALPAGLGGERLTIAYADDAGNWGLPAAFPPAR